MRKIPFSRSMLVPGLVVLAIVIVVAVALIIGGDDHKSKPKAANTAQASACGPYRKDGVVVIAGQKFNVEVAKNSAEFAKGLAGRPCILPNQGMLFVFNRSGQYPFWMKGMNFPIDIVWINSAHKVAALEIDVEPSTYHSQNPYFENDPQHLAQFVFEMQANRSKQLHLGLGVPIQFQNT